MTMTSVEVLTDENLPGHANARHTFGKWLFPSARIPATPTRPP
jgi:hypothetical protein